MLAETKDKEAEHLAVQSNKKKYSIMGSTESQLLLTAIGPSDTQPKDVVLEKHSYFIKRLAILCHQLSFLFRNRGNLLRCPLPLLLVLLAG